MTASLASLQSPSATDPANRDQFFDLNKEIPIIKDYIKVRECPDHTFPPSCDVNLFFGLFFDGTNNNLERDRPNNHSNVARLYETFPGIKDQHGSNAWPDFEKKYHKSFFRTYVPGVGTRFEDVGDSGEGFSVTTSDRAKGLAFAYKSENRILWAMVQTLNNVHRYYTGEPLLDNAQFKKRINQLTLPSGRGDSRALEVAFTALLLKLHATLKTFLPLDAPPKSADKGKVIKIFVSLFGFSRGAAEVRAFTNWFIWLCKLDAKLTGRNGLCLCTIPVTIDFMGLFDTVASVGIAATCSLADGHQGWADSDRSLRFPIEYGPTKCLHLVSAHEIRRSFPLDSLLFLGNLPAGCTEIVFPGVHSDVGGGYAPKEQGRGNDAQGSDMLSRIALAMMYRAARLAGAPLKLEDAADKVKDSFKIDPGMIQAFNAYLGFCGVEKDKRAEPKPLHKIMEEQHRLYILWRKKMAGKMKDLPNVSGKVSKFDMTDIEQSDKELEQEIRNFQAWRNQPSQTESEPFKPTLFSNPEWTAIDQYWSEQPPPSAITDFLEQYVHDSRAWFKPFGNDIPDLLHALELLASQEEDEREWDAHPVNEYGSNPYRMTKAQRDRLLKYKSVKGTPNELDAVNPDKDGREPISNSKLFIVPGGYLRYRSIYMGSDSFKPAGAQYAGLLPTQAGDGRRWLANQDRDRVEEQDDQISIV